MTDLNNNKIPIYAGINDQPRPALPNKGANGAWMTKAINDLIDEIELLKQLDLVESAYLNFSRNYEISEENSIIQLLPSCPFDIFLVNFLFVGAENFSSIILEVDGNNINLNPGESSEIFVFDEELISYSSQLSLTLSVSPDKIPIIEPISIFTSLGALTELSFFQEESNLPQI